MCIQRLGCRCQQWIPLPMGTAAALRRLHFESQVVLTSTIRASVERPDHGAKPIAFADKAARMEDLRGRFTGSLLIRCWMKFAHNLNQERFFLSHSGAAAENLKL